ncbi:MAG: 3-deoxy-D-manno-octulosonic acid transferase [Planctomycetes bacterium]|nr:3-deoxy-D-manno-octulosonic acid transferase [Planctomycetota bacterium]
MRWLADAIYLIAGLIYLPVALYHAVFVGKNRRGWGERFGAVPRFSGNRPRVWIHAVSLGEINCTPQLVAELRARLPDWEIVFSTTTDTGFARGVALFGREHVFRFPLDFSVVVARVLDRVRPTLIVLVELEVWYNLVRQAARRGIPIAVVNGRLTERSRRRLARLGGLTRQMFARLTWVGAQDETIAARFRACGADEGSVEVTGSLKWDTATVMDGVPGDRELARAMGADGTRPLWVCGSTGPGEEGLILAAFRRLLQPAPAAASITKPAGRPTDPACVAQPLLAIVPRKPERFEEVARLIGQAGFRCVRRSARPDGTPGAPVDTAAVLLGDTMGELRKFYALARVVFVGRSLVPMGGSDPMEVAALGRPILIGPYVDNFRSPVDLLYSAGAVRIVSDAESLAESVAALLGDPALAASMGARARGVVLEHQGATRRTAERLVRIAHRKTGTSGDNAGT